MHICTIAAQTTPAWLVACCMASSHCVQHVTLGWLRPTSIALHPEKRIALHHQLNLT